MSPFDLSGKTIFITGASSGIGRQTAVSVSELGANVIVTGRNIERLNETFGSLAGQGHLAINANLTDKEELNSLFAQLPEMNGIVHCAGITSHMPAQFISEKHLSDIFDVNYLAPVLLNTKILKKKKLLIGSSIVFISSVTTQKPYFGGAVYVSSKAAIEGYSKVLSLELAAKGIRSNCISPGYVKTAMIDGSEDIVSKEVMDNIEKAQLLGAGKTSDVANAAIYFLSDASRWVTGTNLLLGG